MLLGGFNLLNVGLLNIPQSNGGWEEKKSSSFRETEGGFGGGGGDENLFQSS